MATNLQHLLDQACHPDHPAEIRRLARNHALDLTDIQATHPDAATCGNQIPTNTPLWESADYAFGPVPSDVDEQIIYYDRLERVLTRLLDAQRGASPYGVMSDLSETIRLARFIDLHTLYTCWSGGKGVASLKHMRTSLERLQHQLENKPESVIAQHRPDFNLIWLARHEPQTVVWVLQHDEFRQHEGDYTARDWVRHLALPGYASEADYQRKAGLVAVEYELDAQQLHKPTVVEAGNSPVFFPGYQHETCGRTAPLSSDGQAPWSRADSRVPGLAEYVHTNRTIAAVQPHLRYLGDF
ncbi:MAG: hypothetical protein AAFP10_03890 [Pseudomonadota bacterium]